MNILKKSKNFLILFAYFHKKYQSKSGKPIDELPILLYNI